jgi:hypothetical protein
MRVSATGIVALARHAFTTWSLSAPMVLIIDAYGAVRDLLLGWAAPYLQAALMWLGSFIGWRPTLYPHWKDVFMLISMIGISAGRAFWRVAVFDTKALRTGLIWTSCTRALGGRLAVAAPLVTSPKVSKPSSRACAMFALTWKCALHVAPDTQMGSANGASSPDIPGLSCAAPQSPSGYADENPVIHTPPAARAAGAARPAKAALPAPSFPRSLWGADDPSLSSPYGLYSSSQGE